MAHILVDTANTFFRARHVIRGDTSEKIGMAIHIMMNSIKKAWEEFDGTHVVFCLEERSWRKDHYAPYKRNRKDAVDAMTNQEKEENEVFWECYDDFCKFIAEKTNVTVLRNPRAEADDLIARWIDKHPDQKHVIISTDKDLNQLVSSNVKQYNGVSNTTITHEGYFDDKGKEVIDKKTKLPKEAPNPQWLLFEKCMRGDTSDNVFSAFPGVRKKGTRNKVGLLEAFEDRESKGLLNKEIKNSLGKIAYQVACHQRVQNIGPKTKELLELVPETEVQAIERCSGHDGTYAVREETHKNSVKIARPVSRKVDESEPDHLTSDCPLAAKQIQHVSKNKPDSAHPISLIKKAYGVD